MTLPAVSKPRNSPALACALGNVREIEDESEDGGDADSVEGGPDPAEDLDMLRICRRSKGRVGPRSAVVAVVIIVISIVVVVVSSSSGSILFVCSYSPGHAAHLPAE